MPLRFVYLLETMHAAAISCSYLLLQVVTLSRSQGQVLIWRGDITQLAADVIVNAANEARCTSPWWAALVFSDGCRKAWAAFSRRTAAAVSAE